MPEVSIFPAYSADAMVAARVAVPDVVPANKIKALAGHDKTASVFAWIGKHPLDKKHCACFVCTHTTEAFDPFKRASWYQHDPAKPYVRFDIGARNVRLKLRGGEFFVVVADCDVDEWLDELSHRDRLGLMLALPLTIERTTRREVAAE